MQIFLSMLTNLLNCASKLGLSNFNGKGTLVLSSGFSLSIMALSSRSLTLFPLMSLALAMVSSNLLTPKEIALTWALGLASVYPGKTPGV